MPPASTENAGCGRRCAPARGGLAQCAPTADPTAGRILQEWHGAVRASGSSRPIILYAACAVLGARLLWSDAADPGAADLTAQMQRFEAQARVARVCMIASFAGL